MKWSSFLHVMTVLIGLLAIAAAVTGWILRERPVVMGWTGNDLAEKSILLILIAIWTALGTLIHQVKEDKEED